MVEALNRRLFAEAKRYIPGGVNSPVRSFKAVGGDPIFIKQGKGSKVYGEDGRRYIDYCLSWGALILGHSHPKVTTELKKNISQGTSFGTPTNIETELARMIAKAIPSMERIRLTNSGTEAVMAAIRLARAFTKKERIIKFEGSYHGHADYLLDCEGVPKDFKKNTLELPYNDIEGIEEAAEKYHKEIAAIIVEPVAANMGVVLPRLEFLQTLRKIATKYNIILIFDEVITGFRLGFGGAERLFGIKPDLTCLGKIIGGGLPVGAFGASREITALLAPEGNAYQAGTFSGNRMTVTAGLATLKVLNETDPYDDLETKTDYLCDEMERRAKIYNIKVKVNSIGSLFSIFFVDREVHDYSDAARSDTNLFKRFYHGLLKEGIYFSPSHLESDFLSVMHSAQDIDGTIKAVDSIFKKL